MRYFALLFILTGLLNGQQVEFNSQAKRYVELLTSKAFMGRGYTHQGHEKAANFIQRELKNMGLHPIDSSYTHTFPIQSNLFITQPELKLNGRSLILGEEFIPHEHSASGDTISEAILDVGHGIYVPNTKLNPYHDIVINDVLLLMDNDLPVGVRRNKALAKYASEQMRIHIAQQLGSAGILFLQEKLTFGASYTQADMPVFRVKKDAVQWPVKSVTYNLKSAFRSINTKNVFAAVKGTVYPDSIIMLSAHYDHLGAMGDKVYFSGANDNASGVALLLDLARYFKNNPLKYTLMFVFFSGQDLGLVGSEYFYSNPPIDLKKIHFLLNFDMVASGDNGIMVVGGQDFPNYFSILKQESVLLKIGPLAKRKNIPNGDQFFFLNSGIKGFYLYARDGAQHYHHINDKPSSLDWQVYHHFFKLSKAFLEKL